MAAIMQSLRDDPPRTLAGLAVRSIRDYAAGVQRDTNGQTTPLAVPQSDLLFFDTELPGNYAAIRPSGTEPKLKYYLFAYRPPNAGDRQRQRAEVRAELEGMEADLLARG